MGGAKRRKEAGTAVITKPICKNQTVIFTVEEVTNEIKGTQSLWVTYRLAGAHLQAPPTFFERVGEGKSLSPNCVQKSFSSSFSHFLLHLIPSCHPEIRRLRPLLLWHRLPTTPLCSIS